MIPKESEFEVPILLEVESAGGNGRPRDLYPKIASHFQEITKADWTIRTKSGVVLLTNRIQFARQRLVEKGELDKTVRGVWRITDKGRARLRGSVEVQPLPRHDKVVAKSRHQDLCDKIKEMGRLLGKNTEPWAGALYKHDAVWKDNPFKSPFLAWEVCDSGNVDKDIASLQWAFDNWAAAGVLVMVDGGEIDKVKQKLPPAKRIIVTSAAILERLFELTREGREFLRVVFSLRS